MVSALHLVMFFNQLVEVHCAKCSLPSRFMATATEGDGKFHFALYYFMMKLLFSHTGRLRARRTRHPREIKSALLWAVVNVQYICWRPVIKKCHQWYCRSMQEERKSTQTDRQTDSRISEKNNSVWPVTLPLTECRGAIRKRSSVCVRTPFTRPVHSAYLPSY